MWVGGSPSSHRVLILVREKEKQKVTNRGKSGFLEGVISYRWKEIREGYRTLGFMVKFEIRKWCLKKDLMAVG